LRVANFAATRVTQKRGLNIQTKMTATLPENLYCFVWLLTFHVIRWVTTSLIDNVDKVVSRYCNTKYLHCGWPTLCKRS